MKRFSLFLSVFILLLASETTFAQTASDYYLPLSVGNYLQFRTSEKPSGSNWGTRIATTTIEGSDSISGRQYFREREIEKLDGRNGTNFVHLFWLRKDSVGNVALGAMSTTGSSDIDSATLVSGYIFYNQFLTKGYSMTVPYGKQTVQDSVVSVNEIVSGSAGTFNNCLKLCVTHFDSTGSPVQQDYDYYAYRIGLVKSERTLPLSQANTCELIEYVTTGVSDDAANPTPRNFSLSQNYPNPFNPSTVINYQVTSPGNVSLKVFDLLGREVATLVNDVKTVGSYKATFIAANMPSGVYFYRLQAGSFTETKKLLLLR